MILKNKIYYFLDAEISWANLDALALKEKLEFEKAPHTFQKEIDKEGGRYALICKLVGFLILILKSMQKNAVEIWK